MAAMKKQRPVKKGRGGAMKKQKPVAMRGGGSPKRMKKGGDTGMSVSQLRAAAKQKGYKLVKE
tara:strand:- start:387 stop:575 length:189 start_codon:yes stop_codon:yes gene_type:complete